MRVYCIHKYQQRHSTATVADSRYLALSLSHLVSFCVCHCCYCCYHGICFSLFTHHITQASTFTIELVSFYSGLYQAADAMLYAVVLLYTLHRDMCRAKTHTLTHDAVAYHTITYHHIHIKLNEKYTQKKQLNYCACDWLFKRMIIWTTHICKCVCGYAQIERCYLLSECRMCVIRNDICSTLARCKIYVQLIRSLLWCVIAFASYFQRYTHSSMWLWHARKQYISNSLSAIRYSPSLLLSPLSSLYCIFIVCCFSRYKDITYSKCGCV